MKTQAIVKPKPEDSKGGNKHLLTPPPPKPRTTGISHHWSLISLHINGLNLSRKKTQAYRLDMKTGLTFRCMQEIYLNFKDIPYLRVKV